MKKTLNVLVSSASGKAPLIRAMQAAIKKVGPNGKVIAGDMSAESTAAYVADSFWLMPPAKDEYIDLIIYGMRERKINMVLPTRDGELIFWSRHTERIFSEGITVLTSKTASIQRCLDKLEFSNFGQSKGLPFIYTTDNISTILYDRFVVKERFGSGSKSIAINIDRAKAYELASKLNHPIFQPFINGKEFSVDAWVDKTHCVKALALRHRNKIVNGESQITTTFSDFQLEQEISKIIEQLELCGPVVLQVILDQYKHIHVIECNPRFGGASTAGIFVGVDSFYWSILESLGMDLKKYSFFRARSEVRQVRIQTDIYVSDSNF